MFTHFFNSKKRQSKFREEKEGFGFKKTKKIYNILKPQNGGKYFKSRKKFRLKQLPYFKIPKKNVWNYYVGFFIILIFLIISILFGGAFSLKHIEIIRQDDISNINIAYKSLEDIRSQSIFSLDSDNLIHKLKSYQENLNNVEINFSLPDTIKISIASSPAIFNTNLANKNYLLLQNGTLIPKNPKTSLTNIEIKNAKNLFSLVDYKKIFKESYIKKIQEIQEKLKENIIGVEINKISYYEREREAHFFINNNTRLIFDINSDTAEQIKKAAVFHREKNGILKNGIIYIDLRVKNKLFLCDISEEFDCRMNLKKIYGE